MAFIKDTKGMRVRWLNVYLNGHDISQPPKKSA